MDHIAERSSVEAGAANFNRAAALALLAFAQLIISLDINIVFVALPKIGEGLNFSGQTLQWVVSAYTVFCGGFLLFGGRAADLIGQRRLFITALGLYAISSLVGGLAWEPTVIIAARAVQGIGGAFLFPATLSLVNRLFAEGAERNRALAVWGGAGASGLMIGSLAGGFLTSAFGWPSVFFVNVFLALIAIVAAFFVIPRDPRVSHGRSFDVSGALTVTGGATLLVFALVQGPVFGWNTAPILWAFGLSALLLLAFMIIESQSRDPLMPLRLFGNRMLVTSMAITFLYMGTFGALPYFLTVLFQDIHHFTASQTGLAFLVPSLAIAAGTQIGERYASRFSARSTLIAGMLVGAAGTVIMVAGAWPESSYAAIVPGLLVSGIGQGVVWTAMWIIASSGVPDHEQGVASGMASTTMNIGNAVGLAVLVGFANAYAGFAGGKVSAGDLASGVRLAFWLCAAGGVIATAIAVATLFRPRRSQE